MPLSHVYRPACRNCTRRGHTSVRRSPFSPPGMCLHFYRAESSSATLDCSSIFSQCCLIHHALLALSACQSYITQKKKVILRSMSFKNVFAMQSAPPFSMLPCQMAELVAECQNKTMCSASAGCGFFTIQQERARLVPATKTQRIYARNPRQSGAASSTHRKNYIPSFIPTGTPRTRDTSCTGLSQRCSNPL